VLYFRADARDGGPAGGVSCQSCCCQVLNLRPGETNLVTINYAPWSLPIQGPGIVPVLEFHLEADRSSCPTGVVEGFTPPSNTNYELTTAQDAALTVDLSVNALPAGNTFSYKVVMFSGPKYGTIVQTGTAGDPTFTYTPNGGYTGYDYFSYEMEDAQGRSVIRHVRVSVGTHLDRREPARMALEPFVDSTKIQTLTQVQEVRFPISMPTNVKECERFRMTVKQPAKDCDGNLYHHLMCFDIIPKDCG
jgi:hypothetical protein